MAKYVTEFIGAFFLVLTIALAVAFAGPLAPVAVGAVLIALIYMGGHVSGAHYNPAVTLAILLRGKCTPKDAAFYMVAQIAGGVAAALLLYLLTNVGFKPGPGEGVVIEGISIAQILAAETLFTFLLALVVLNVATHPKTQGNGYFGVAIGLTVMAGAFTVSKSGAAFNPAVALGQLVFDSLKGGGVFGDIWLYLVGPFAGAALASLVFKLQLRET